VSVDQLPGESIFHVYKREGEPGSPHDHSAELLTFKGGADATDGLDVSSAALGPNLPDGLMVAMNSGSRNFLLFHWRDIAVNLSRAPRSPEPAAGDCVTRSRPGSTRPASSAVSSTSRTKSHERPAYVLIAASRTHRRLAS